MPRRWLRVPEYLKCAFGLLAAYGEPCEMFDKISAASPQNCTYPAGATFSRSDHDVSLEVYRIQNGGKDRTMCLWYLLRDNLPSHPERCAIAYAVDQTGRVRNSAYQGQHVYL
jgi:hypothetical protein